MSFSAFDGHSGLEYDVQDEQTVGDFETALCYVKEQNKGHFVVHAYSSKFDVGPKIDRNAFLEHIGFKPFEGCNVLNKNDCYYRVLKSVDRNPMPDPTTGEQARRQYEAFVDSLEERYKQYREVDGWFQEIGSDAAHR